MARVSSRSLACTALALSGLLGLVASAQPWWHAGPDSAQVGFPGTAATAGLSQALVLVAVAGLLLALSLRGRGRGVLAVLLAGVGTAMVVLGVLRPRPDEAAVRARLRQTSLVDHLDLTPSGWPYLYAAAGLGVLLGAVVMLLRASRWPQRSDRFQRPGAGVGAVSDAVDPADATALWRALDAGVDPTLAGSDPPAPSSTFPAAPRADDDPGVRTQVRNDTMGRSSRSDRDPGH
jgi:uncharacterized membrane protein (TIGR02234 family)